MLWGFEAAFARFLQNARKENVLLGSRAHVSQNHRVGGVLSMDKREREASPEAIHSSMSLSWRLIFRKLCVFRDFQNGHTYYAFRILDRNIFNLTSEQIEKSRFATHGELPPQALCWVRSRQLSSLFLFVFVFRVFFLDDSLLEQL